MTKVSLNVLQDLFCILKLDLKITLVHFVKGITGHLAIRRHILAIKSLTQKIVDSLQKHLPVIVGTVFKVYNLKITVFFTAICSMGYSKNVA